MTYIITGVKTKKQLKTLAEDWNISREMKGYIWITDPSIVHTFNEGHAFLLEDTPRGHSFVCTNHPRRSWFAHVRMTEDGYLSVQ